MAALSTVSAKRRRTLTGPGGIRNLYRSVFGAQAKVLYTSRHVPGAETFCTDLQEYEWSHLRNSPVSTIQPMSGSEGPAQLRRNRPAETVQENAKVAARARARRGKLLGGEGDQPGLRQRLVAALTPGHRPCLIGRRHMSSQGKL